MTLYHPAKMRVQYLRLRNFKRFTDLEIGPLAQETKLVLIVGANGSGKSCVFDALNQFAARGPDESYLRKNADQEWFAELQLHDVDEPWQAGRASTAAERSRFFGRPSQRIVPSTQFVNDAPGVIEEDRDRAHRFTLQDERFNADAARFAEVIEEALRTPTFEGRSADTVAIFKEHIEPVNDALRRVFGDDLSVTIQLKNYRREGPKKTVQLVFSKGSSAIPYDYLSHGEKQVVILLLGFLVRRSRFEDALIFIDEMDLHLSTALQRDVLSEITEHWIPDSSQLWTASHALGFIEYARDSEVAALIDLDSLNFDEKQAVAPVPQDDLEVVEIAVPRDSLARLFAERTIVVCEGGDAKLYNAAFEDSSGEHRLIFVPPLGPDNAEAVLRTVRGSDTYVGLRDRDFLQDEEVQILAREVPNLHILPYYSIENLLWHPENIASLDLEDFDEHAWANEIRVWGKEHAVREVKHARGRIAELRTVGRLKQQRAWDAEPEGIYSDQRSNDFELFYRVVPMKVMPKTALAHLQLRKIDLARAPWFRDRVRQVLSP